MSIFDEWTWRELEHWRIIDGSIDYGIDWCEPNWTISPYIAEFFNTISTLPTLIQFIALLLNICHFSNIIETRYFVWLIAYASAAVAGIVAHSSLSHLSGIIDETILFINGLILIFILTNTWNVQKINTLWYFTLIILPITWFLILELVPVAGSILTVSSQICVGLMQIWFIWTLYSTKAFINVENILKYYIIGFPIYILGVIFAVCDILLCSYISYSIFHAIWHLCLGITSHMLFICLVKIRLYVLNRHHQIQEIKYFPFCFINVNKCDHEVSSKTEYDQIEI